VLKNIPKYYVAPAPFWCFCFKVPGHFEKLFSFVDFCSVGFKARNLGQLLSEILRSYIRFSTENSLEFERGAIFFLGNKH
jgi:hypothetical protein